MLGSLWYQDNFGYLVWPDVLTAFCVGSGNITLRPRRVVNRQQGKGPITLGATNCVGAGSTRVFGMVVELRRKRTG